MIPPRATAGTHLLPPANGERYVTLYCLSSRIHFIKVYEDP
jgi:hypothetical protein